MDVTFEIGLNWALETLNQILAAGIAINAFGLLLYALTFNLRDRVARSFALILLCVTIVFTAEAMGSTASEPWVISTWLRIQWVGIVFLPPVYLHFSDALLATTGKPSRGRRRLAVRLTYLFSGFLALLLPFSRWVGPLVLDQGPAPYLGRTIFTEAFTLYYIVVLAVAWINLVRAFRRTVTPTSRRRMAYLLIGALAPALGSYPYLMFGSNLVVNFPLVFWLLAVFSNLLVGGLIIVMAYAVAFFGVTCPDRVVKSRLFQWLMRGPVTAFVALGITTVVRRLGAYFGLPYSAVVPIVMVVSILLLEYAITLLAPLWERAIFSARDRRDLAIVRAVEQRFLTQNDLRQFLEMVLAAACDQVQSPGGFIAVLEEERLERLVRVGREGSWEAAEILERVDQPEAEDDLFSWDGTYLISLSAPTGPDQPEPVLLGVMGLIKPEPPELDEDEVFSLRLLAERAAAALAESRVQQNALRSLQSLQPQVDLIQRLRAAGQYDRRGLLSPEPPAASTELTQWVREALVHYWGGPKLTESPLLKLRIVQEAVQEHEGNTANALRAILRRAIEQVKPEGERRFTGEWILYNILEMKFLEGRKVREIALRLAMSEADLYRKQRVAIEAVAKAILEMEQQTQGEHVQP